MNPHHQPPEPSHLDLALAEIANRASRLAHRVRGHEVGPPELVAELMEIVTVAEGMIGGEGISALEIAPADFPWADVGSRGLAVPCPCVG